MKRQMCFVVRDKVVNNLFVFILNPAVKKGIYGVSNSEPLSEGKWIVWRIVVAIKKLEFFILNLILADLPTLC